MSTMRLSMVLFAGTCLWAGYQFTYVDGLTSIDSSKWTQIGSLSTGANGVTGNGSLISTVAVPTGDDYDVSMTIHTANQGPCTGSYSLYARSTPDNTTSYALTINSGSIVLFKKVANSWTALTWMPYYCADGTVTRLVVRGGNITFWSGPFSDTYRDPSPIAAGHPGVGISSSADAIGNVQIGPIGYLPPSAVSAPAVQTSTAPNRVDLRWPASADDANGAGMQGYVVYRDGVYLGSPLTPSWLDQTVSGGEATTYSIYAADQHGNLSAPALVSVSVPEGLNTTAANPDAQARLGRPTAKSVPTGPSVRPERSRRAHDRLGLGRCRGEHRSAFRKPEFLDPADQGHGPRQFERHIRAQLQLADVATGLRRGLAPG